MLGLCLAALLAACVALVLVATVSANTIVEVEEPKERVNLDTCQPAWDPSDSRIVTYNGRTLHDEPASVRAMFYQVWGDANDQHLRRWRWEYECANVPPVENQSQQAQASSGSGDPNLLLAGYKGSRHGCNNFVDTSGKGDPDHWHCHGTSYHQHPGDYRKPHPERLAPKRDKCTATGVDYPGHTDWHCHGDVLHSHGFYEGETVSNHRH